MQFGDVNQVQHSCWPSSDVRSATNNRPAFFWRMWSTPKEAFNPKCCKAEVTRAEPAQSSIKKGSRGTSLLGFSSAAELGMENFSCILGTGGIWLHAWSCWRVSTPVQLWFENSIWQSESKGFLRFAAFNWAAGSVSAQKRLQGRLCSKHAGCTDSQFFLWSNMLC